MGRYVETFKRSLEDKEGFWAEVAEGISWEKKWDKVLDDSNPPFYKWFVGGQLNTCYNALDRHVEGGRADQDAMIYDSPVTDTLKKYTYRELRDEVAKVAGALRDMGVGKGDTVILYMPMVPQAAMAMLACARIGAVHSVVFGGFAPNELAIRIDDAKPKVIISASCGIEGAKVIAYKPLLDKAIELAESKPTNCLIMQRPQVAASMIEGRDLDWEETVAKAAPADCVTVEATDPLYILYTSGTTGIPKGIVRDNGGHAVALMWSMKNVYNVEPGDVYWAASDVGWVVGHSYIVYAPLFLGATTIVKTLFTAPTAFRAIKKEDPNGEYYKKYDMSNFKCLFLAGERTDPDTYYWARDLLGTPVIDHWWQTESGWAIAANCMGLEQYPVKAGSPTLPVPGYDVKILGNDGQELGPDEEGIVAIKMPLPPGCLPTLWNNDKRYQESYMDPFPGYYFTGDGGYMDADGYVYIMGRVDDVINVAGHRLSTGAMEEIIATHDVIAECAVFGADDKLKGQVPVGVLVLKAGAEDTDEAKLVAELVKMVRDLIGPIACFKQATIVKRLPKTRSGKILRGTMRKIADGAKYSVPSTIDDPAILGEIEEALTTIGYAAK